MKSHEIQLPKNAIKVKKNGGKPEKKTQKNLLIRVVFKRVGVVGTKKMPRAG